MRRGQHSFPDLPDDDDPAMTEQFVKSIAGLADYMREELAELEELEKRKLGKPVVRALVTRSGRKS